MSKSTAKTSEPVRVLIGDDSMFEESGFASKAAFLNHLSNCLAPITKDAARAAAASVVVSYCDAAAELQRVVAATKWDFIALDNHWEQQGDQFGFEMAKQLRTASGPNARTPLCIFTKHDWLKYPDNINHVFALDDNLGDIETFADFFPKTPRNRYSTGTDWLNDFGLQLLVRMKACFRLRKCAAEVRVLREQLSSRYEISDIVGESSAIRTLRDSIIRYAPESATVLILADSGTGKELVAGALHYHSPRRSHPFVPVNCTAIAETLLESELFGHEKGAFTGATASKQGRFEEADGGTLFLDEIGEMKPELQTKLLRVLEERRFRHVGGSQDIEVDVRIVAATNCNMRASVENGRFRRDLYYRLSVLPISIPPLRERSEDIPLLAKHFVDFFNRGRNRPVREITADALLAMRTYSWPGNVRELRNAIERAVIHCSGDSIDPQLLPDEVRAGRGLPNVRDDAPRQQQGESVRTFLDKYVKWAIPHSLLRYAGSSDVVKKAAQDLGYSQSRFCELAKQTLGMNTEEWLRKQQTRD